MNEQEKWVIIFYEEGFQLQVSLQCIDAFMSF